MTFDDIKEMQIGSKKVMQAWLNGKQVYPSKKRIMDSLVCWYDIGKQQCTNESMASNPVLADLSGNGHDITCYNFAWAGMSGIGGYPFKEMSRWFKSPNNNGIYTIEGYKLYITKGNTAPNVYYCTNNVLGTKNDFPYIDITDDNKTFTTKPFKIKINGLPEGKNVVINGIIGLTSGSEHANVTMKRFSFGNGEHTVPSIQTSITSENDTWNNQINFPSIHTNFIDSDELDVDITIEILPLYPNALVSDGVDDYCYTDGLPILTDYTVIAKRKWLSTEIPNAHINLACKGITQGAFIFERYEKDKATGITYSFGGYNSVIHIQADDITYQTATSYNGVEITKGENVDVDNLVLLARNTTTGFAQIALYSFLLFDRTLTTAEIEWVKQNMIESGGGVGYELE